MKGIIEGKVENEDDQGLTRDTNGICELGNEQKTENPQGDDKKVDEPGNGNRNENQEDFVFEKVLFCKTRFMKDRGSAGGRLQTKLRKSFWMFPFPTSELSAEEKEEADLLSTFGFNQSKMSRMLAKKGEPLEFVYEFFASFKVEESNLLSFALNNNKNQAEYQNDYNPSGLRYFFGCQFLDFEYVQKANLSKSPSDSKFELEVSQSLILLEAKYPFKTFYESILKLIFNIIRVKRLELYALNFNGNSKDDKNFEFLKKYDATSVGQVTQC